ncbi:ribonuclease HI family protein [Candidatus Falkowbacteria bacterium]|nr:ribonuclease HI family protein [Candidatus Falkowbacteria bacterium]
MPKKLKIYTDGGARGNPGPAAFGVVVEDLDGKMVGKFSKYLGETTNNQAEYQAVHFALEKAKEMRASEVEIFSDSELIVKQLNQDYKIKNEDLGKWFLKIWNLRQEIGKVSFTHIRREKIKRQISWLMRNWIIANLHKFTTNVTNFIFLCLTFFAIFAMIIESK